jgi:carboxypeptidase C (cathepsin A)
MLKSPRFALAGLILAACAAVPWARAAPPPGPASPRVWPVLSDQAVDGPRRFTAHHRGMFGGTSVKYRSTVAETIVSGPDGKPAASAFTLAFTADVKDAASRPVLFIYNGGPGGASSTLFLGALGVYRIEPFTDAAMANAAVHYAPNGESILDAADLVFIDPPDTGFSRRLPDTPPRLFLSIDGDSFAIGQIIQHWLSSNGRRASPVYLVGESYGTLRNVALARDLARSSIPTQLRGLVMISQAIRYNGPEELMQPRGPDPMRAISRMPDAAALAWFHGKIDNQHQTVGEVIDKARLFARTEYASALLQGNKLGNGERERVAAKLAELSGIPAQYYLTHDLRIANLRRELLKPDGRALAQFDGRQTEPLEGLPEDKDRDWDAAFAGLDHAMQSIAQQELGVKGLERYISLVHDPYGYEEGWTYVVPPSPTLDAVLTEVMRQNHGLRLLVPQGIFDTTSSMGSTVSMFQQLDIPADRVAVTYYSGGHMVYADADSLKKFMNDLRTFVSGGTPSDAFPTLKPGRPSS